MIKRLHKLDNILHSIPEIGMQEYKTAEFIRKTLGENNISYDIVAGTGTLVYFEGKTEEILAFRADIDALPLGDSSNHTSPSVHSGLAHACGHSGHTSALLETVLRVDEDIKSNQIPDKSLLFIFQPGEEGFAGAKHIIEDSNFDKYKDRIEAFFATHLMPQLEEGSIATRDGVFSAQNITLKWNIKGKGCHGAQPHEGIDIVVIVSELIGAYQTIRSRNIDPDDMYLLSIGRFLTGSLVEGEFLPGGAGNIIPDYIQMEGTIRIYDSKYIDISRERLESINRGFEQAYGLKIDMSLRTNYPSMYNDENLHREILSLAERLDIPVSPAPKLTGSEDFSFFKEIAPTFMYLTGVRNEKDGHTASLHNPGFGYSSTALETIVNINLEIIRSKNC